MLVNDTRDNDAPRVTFVSYSGEYPHLCSGELRLLIDGTEYIFGCDSGTKMDEDAFLAFWNSTCDVWFDNGVPSVTGSEWETDVNRLPEFLQPLAEEIDEVFNANVEHGGCGGCA